MTDPDITFAIYIAHGNDPTNYIAKVAFPCLHTLAALTEVNALTGEIGIVAAYPLPDVLESLIEDEYHVVIMPGEPDEDTSEHDAEWFMTYLESIRRRQQIQAHNN